MNKCMGEEAVEQMTVLVVEPGYAPYEKTIPHDVYAMQEIVGGPITSVYPYNDPVAIVANDEGILLGMDLIAALRAAMADSLAHFLCAA